MLRRNELALAQFSQQVFLPVALLRITQHIGQFSSQHHLQIFPVAGLEVAQVLQTTKCAGSGSGFCEHWWVSFRERQRTPADPVFQPHSAASAMASDGRALQILQVV